mgnify:CR=1 FL=1
MKLTPSDVSVETLLEMQLPKDAVVHQIHQTPMEGGDSFESAARMAYYKGCCEVILLWAIFHWRGLPLKSWLSRLWSNELIGREVEDRKYFPDSHIKVIVRECHVDFLRSAIVQAALLNLAMSRSDGVFRPSEPRVSANSRTDLLSNPDAVEWAMYFLVTGDIEFEEVRDRLLDWRPE